VDKEKFDEPAKSRDEIERLIGAGRKVFAVKDAGQGMYAIEEYDPETKQRREIAASVEKLYALEFAAIHNAFPAILAYVRELESERDEWVGSYLAELDGRTKDHGKELLAARDAQQRRDGAVMKLLDMSLGGFAWDETGLRREAEAMLLDAGERERYEQLLAEAKRIREGM
jgi:hypothetical protein